jgi:hypothetical protein
MVRRLKDSRDLFRCLVAPIGLIGIIHVLCGVTMILEPEGGYISGVYGFGLMGSFPKGVMLVIVGGLAIAARIGPVPRELERAFTMPQQVVLLWQLCGIVLSVWSGVYPNGHEPVPGSYWGSVIFILSDQMPWLMLCLSHTVELVFADCLLARVRNHYEALLQEERISLMRAEKLLAMYNETQFWNSLNGDGKWAVDQAESASKTCLATRVAER